MNMQDPLGPRPDGGGGGETTPFYLSFDSSKTKSDIATKRNFIYPFLYQICTSWPKEFPDVLMALSLMTSEWRHVLPISVKMWCAGIIKNLILKIEPIGLYQKM